MLTTIDVALSALCGVIGAAILKHAYDDYENGEAGASMALGAALLSPFINIPGSIFYYSKKRLEELDSSNPVFHDTDSRYTPSQIVAYQVAFATLLLIGGLGPLLGGGILHASGRNEITMSETYASVWVGISAIAAPFLVIGACVSFACCAASCKERTNYFSIGAGSGLIG